MDWWPSFYIGVYRIIHLTWPRHQWTELMNRWSTPWIRELVEMLLSFYQSHWKFQETNLAIRNQQAKSHEIPNVSPYSWIKSCESIIFLWLWGPLCRTSLQMSTMPEGREPHERWPRRWPPPLAQEFHGAGARDVAHDLRPINGGFLKLGYPHFRKPPNCTTKTWKIRGQIGQSFKKT